METKFNFKSQICTDKNQSERLLALGLKKETADMYWWQETNEYQELNGRWHCQLLSKYTKEHFDYLDNTFGVDLVGDIDDGAFLPAWSLHRLIEMMPKEVEFPLSGMPKDFRFEIHNGLVRYYNGHVCCVMEGGGYYEGIINSIKWLIKEGYFNKEYLV